MQARGQGVGEQAQGFGQRMATERERFMQDLATRGQMTADQAQYYNQQMGGRAQNFGEFMQMYGAQAANDQARQSQGQQAITSMLNALGFNAAGVQQPEFPPGFWESAGTAGANLLPMIMAGMTDGGNTNGTGTGGL
jgi:hypothetical protein